MSIKKNLIAVAAMALTTMGLASSAMAQDGVLRHTETTTPIAKNVELHVIGGLQWAAGGGAGTGMKCDVTANIKVTGEEGKVAQITSLTIPDTTKCTGLGGLGGCTLKNDAVKGTPYNLTVTPTEVDITSLVTLEYEYGGFCFFTKHTIELSALKLLPIKTGNAALTGTNGKMADGGKAATGTATQHGEPIAGWRITGGGKLSDGTEVVASGDLELTLPGRCTYYISSN